MPGQGRLVNQRTSERLSGLERFQLRELHKHLLRGSELDRSTLRQEFEQLLRLGLGAVLLASVRRHRRALRIPATEAPRVRGPRAKAKPDRRSPAWPGINSTDSSADSRRSPAFNASTTWVGYDCRVCGGFPGILRAHPDCGPNVLTLSRTGETCHPTSQQSGGRSDGLGGVHLWPRTFARGCSAGSLSHRRDHADPVPSGHRSRRRGLHGVAAPSLRNPTVAYSGKC